jgi:hypothetical protein
MSSILAQQYGRWDKIFLSNFGQLAVNVFAQFMLVDRTDFYTSSSMVKETPTES